MNPRERVFAEVALRLQLLSREQVEACAQHIAGVDAKPLIDAAIELGMISEEEAALVRMQGERLLARMQAQQPGNTRRAATAGVKVAEERAPRLDPRAEPPSPRRAASGRPRRASTPARNSRAPKPPAGPAKHASDHDSPLAQAQSGPGRRRGPRAWEAPDDPDRGVIVVPHAAAAPGPGRTTDEEPARAPRRHPRAESLSVADTAPVTSAEHAAASARATLVGLAEEPAHGRPGVARAPQPAAEGFDAFPLAQGDEVAHIASNPPPAPSLPQQPRPQAVAPAPPKRQLGAVGGTLLQPHAQPVAQIALETASQEVATPAAGAAPAPSALRGGASVPEAQSSTAHGEAQASAAAHAPAAPEPARNASQPPPRVGARRVPTAGAPRDTYLGKALALAIRHGASDLHVHTGAPLMLRVDGGIRPLSSGQPLSAEAAEKVIAEITTDEQWAHLAKKGEVDFACDIEGLARFRVNVYRQQRGLDAVFRIIPLRPPTLEELGLPARLARLLDYRTGMVLCTGPAGCGKSTTLAALVGSLVETRADHILTVEDPVEYVFPTGRALVNQRQIGNHTRSFSRALRAALREDPDIIAITELRDRETISLAISAAETGHLVLGTLHTGNAAQTIHRMVSSFPAEEQEQVRVMLAESLRAVVSQRLLPNAAGRGRVPAVELLMVNTAVSNLIRDDKTHQLPSVMQTGKAAGMVTLDDSLAELVAAGTVTREAAHRVAVRKERFG